MVESTPKSSMNPHRESTNRKVGFIAGLAAAYSCKRDNFIQKNPRKHNVREVENRFRRWKDVHVISYSYRAPMQVGAHPFMFHFFIFWSPSQRVSVARSSSLFEEYLGGNVSVLSWPERSALSRLCPQTTADINPHTCTSKTKTVPTFLLLV